MPYGESVLHRRSRRNFVQEPLDERQRAAVLESLCEPGFDAYVGLTAYTGSVSTGFLAGKASGMDPGFYLLNPEEGSVAVVQEGDLLKKMAHICLDQQWLAQAAFHVLFLTDLESIEQAWGPRSYRYAMMSAGRRGARLYLAATALGLGCCGIGAFFDYEAQGLLGLQENARMLYLVAVGKVKG
jgi:SagB-type dehydrogenase family enzyme